MRYFDSGSRDPSQALGAWLAAMTDDESVSAVRWQSGFFGAEALGYFVPVFERLATVDGRVSVLVGSNDGTTKHRDVELLLDLTGPPRDGRRLGVVAFDNAYFHPKTFHFERSDGSEGHTSARRISPEVEPPRSMWRLGLCSTRGTATTPT